MTVDEILETEDDFAEAALRAKKVGFDGVWLHAAHLFLINNFLSPTSNKRYDDYGGSFNNRLHFLLKACKNGWNLDWVTTSNSKFLCLINSFY
jgi:2,4-dienoyl-CoA reductase-like NADH-dependent reductase (Old Yellow Enzyme family)